MEKQCPEIHSGDKTLAGKIHSGDKALAGEKT